MRTFRQLVVGPLILMLALSTAAGAQERHAVPSKDLSKAVVQHTTDQNADRAAIREALGRAEVRDVAAGVGIDIDRVAASVDGLTADSLAEAASTARTVNQALTGGASMITVSTTTVILVLLLVILLLLAAD